MVNLSIKEDLHVPEARISPQIYWKIDVLTIKSQISVPEKSRYCTQVPNFTLITRCQGKVPNSKSWIASTACAEARFAHIFRSIVRQESEHLLGTLWDNYAASSIRAPWERRPCAPWPTWPLWPFCPRINRVRNEYEYMFQSNVMILFVCFHESPNHPLCPKRWKYRNKKDKLSYRVFNTFFYFLKLYCAESVSITSMQTSPFLIKVLT